MKIYNIAMKNFTWTVSHSMLQLNCVELEYFTKARHLFDLPCVYVFVCVWREGVVCNEAWINYLFPRARGLGTVECPRCKIAFPGIPKLEIPRLLLLLFSPLSRFSLWERDVIIPLSDTVDTLKANIAQRMPLIPEL